MVAVAEASDIREEDFLTMQMGLAVEGLPTEAVMVLLAVGIVETSSERGSLMTEMQSGRGIDIATDLHSRFPFCFAYWYTRKRVSV